MPVEQIETFRINQYENNLKLLSQQTHSRLEALVTQPTEDYRSEQASPVSQLGSAEMNEQTSRNEDIEYNDTPTARRWVLPDNLNTIADLIETQDQVQSLTPLQGGYAAVHAAAINRKKDEKIIAAFFADAIVGKKGTLTQAYDTNMDVAVTVGAAAATGMNWLKMVTMQEKFIGNEELLEGAEMLNLGIGKIQHSNLLTQAEVIQEKFKIKIEIDPDTGLIKRVGSFNIVVSNKFKLDGNGYRQCPVWMKSGMHLGFWQRPRGMVERKMNKKGKPWEVYADMVAGATRLEESKVGRILCAE